MKITEIKDKSAQRLLSIKVDDREYAIPKHLQTNKGKISTTTTKGDDIIINNHILDLNSGRFKKMFNPVWYIWTVLFCVLCLSTSSIYLLFLVGYFYFAGYYASLRGSRLKAVNVFFFQWFFMRLEASVKKDVCGNYTVIDYYSIMGVVWPLTGWISKYIFLTKKMSKRLGKHDTQ